MIEDIITLTKESEYKSREIAVEKRKGDVLLYDVSMRLEILLISLKCSHFHKKPLSLNKDMATLCNKMQRRKPMAKFYGLPHDFSNDISKFQPLADLRLGCNDRRILLPNVKQT